MSRNAYKIVGLGELLWDLLPGGKQLGGAPANFAYISTLLGNEGIVASRVGNDALGNEAVGRLKSLGVGCGAIQRDAVHPTGIVNVQVDDAGQPNFEISDGVAWDFLGWTSEWQTLAMEAGAICFGSLAQRSDVSRGTIRSFLRAARKEAVRVFDVNLRQVFFSKEILAESMKIADIVKLNHEELPRIIQMFGLDGEDEISSCKSLMQMCGMKMICVTRGCHGSLLIGERGQHEHPGFQVRVADTVGSGDAFTAGLVSEYLRGSPVAEMNDVANRAGAWVASQVGAIPVPRNGIEHALEAVAEGADLSG